MNTKNPDEEAAHLRQQAEEKLKSKPFIPPTNKSESLTNKMIHELEVHQVELEMQNEELMSAKKQIEDDIEKYTQLYDFAPSGYFTLAQDGRIIHLNLSAALMLGKERSYLINKRFGVFVDMKSIPDFNYFMEKMFLTNKKESCEISLIYNNQYPITVYLVGSLNPDGEQCSVSMVDITERREAEDALKMSEIRWHTLFEILPVGVSILDKYLDISQSNPALEKILHISHDALNRKKYNHRKYMHADGSPMEFKDFPSNIAIKEQKSVKDIIVGVEKEDGETVWTEVSAAPLHVTDSICAIVTHDITARRRQEDLFKTRLHLLAFAENNSLEEFFEETLNQAEKLTKSCIGFIHLVDEDQKTLRLQAWSTLTKKVFCKAKGLGLHYDLDKAGVWADSLRQRKPIIHNNYEKLVNKKGLPEGHAPILREMVVPVIRNNKVKALLGVGNKPNDYTLADLETISLIADLAWDITQRMMSDREIKQSEEKYRLLLENSGIGVGVFSIDGTIELFNAKAIEIIGGKLEDYIGKSVFEVFSDDVAASYMRRFHETAKSVVSIEFEDYVQFGSRTFWFLSNHTRIINAEGKVIGIQVLAHDITQRKLSEIKLLESETQYRNLANSGSALIWTSGTDKLCNFFNQPWLEFTGHSLEHEVGNGWTEGVHPDDLISCVEIYVSSFDQQKAFEMEYRLRHHSGEYRWIIDMGTPNFNSQG